MASVRWHRPPGARVLRVGPQRELRTLAEAARQARNGDTVEVDAGNYNRDVAVWAQDGPMMRAVGGRVRLIASGGAAEAKAIWVVRGGRITAEGFDFEGTRVPSRKGADRPPKQRRRSSASPSGILKSFERCWREPVPDE